MKRWIAGLLATATALGAASAAADDFAAGSLIIPMDMDYQDDGMFKAYGLVYELLRNEVAVRWVIRTGKGYGDADFTVSATDLATSTPIDAHGYRGGPWVIDERDAADARPIIENWQATYPETAVHEATEPFSGDVARYLVVAPTLAMVADGNQKIARGYMQAAAIPDTTLSLDWGDDSPDMLDPVELAGPTDSSHNDGMLFDEDGDPVYCQLMSMHWGVKDAEENPEVVAEVREFLNHPTHFFAECQAVNAFENLDPHGFFLTPHGFLIDNDGLTEPDFANMDSPFGQLDGEFGFVGGSERAYTLPDGDSYKAGDITMLTQTGTPEGVQDIWMTGFLDGRCPPSAHECGSLGKISYLGGHEYSTDTPISANPDSQGTRLFLNSLFEAPCATVSGQPTLAIAMGAPDTTDDGEVTFLVTYVNTGVVTVLDASLTEMLPEGATIVSASADGVESGTSVTWDLGNLGPGESGDLTVTVQLDGPGLHEASAELTYHVGLNERTLTSNVSTVVFGAGGVGSGGASGATGGAATSAGADSSGGRRTENPGSAGTAGASAPSTDVDAGDAQSDGADSGGCGCRTTNGNSHQSVAGSLLLLAALLLRRRRTAVTHRPRSILAVLASLALAAGCSGGGNDGDSDDSQSVGSGGGSGGGSTTSGSGGSGSIQLNVGNGGDDGTDQHGCEKIDFLFLIDSSESMKDHQANLVASFPGFVEALVDAGKANAWHVMVVDTDAQWGGARCANACDTLGSCPDEPDFPCDVAPPELCDITIGAGEVAPYGEAASNSRCGLADDHRYSTASQGDLSEIFSCMAQVGVDGNSEERQMDALIRALSPELNDEGGCNEGFLRDDAILVLTLITDEPDQYSEGDASTWAQAIVDAKNGNEDAIVLLGLLPDGDAPTPICKNETGTEPASELGEFLDLVPAHTRASVCEPDYSAFFESAVSVISKTCDEFEVIY
jgi:uncharacterized repeat protein (TIGR01451 family)/MYXO-CTERM domain-containing protein